MALDVSNLNSTIQAPINFVYMRGLLSAARKKLPFFNGTLPGKLEKAGGSMSVKWRRIENLTAVTTAISEHTENGPAVFGLGRSTVKPTITDVTKAIAKYGNAVLLTEEIDLFQINSNTMALMETLGANAGESLNGVMRLEFDNATQIRYASSASNKSAVVAEMKANDIKYAVNVLNRNSAMKQFSMATGTRNINTSTVRESYFGICHPDVEEDIRNITGFIGVEQYGGYTEVLVGEFGAVNGVRWVSTEIAPIETGAGTTSTSSVFRHTGVASSADQNDLYTSYIYGKEAIGSIGLGENHAKEIYMMYDRVPTVELISHKPGSSGIADMFNEMGSIAWKAWFGGKILNGNWVVKILTLAKALT
jgi:N4-gp56 family major capsid protein